jgi:hypothetical protein
MTEFTADEAWSIDWLQRVLSLDTPIEFTPDQARCAAVLSVIDRPYNLHTPTSVTESIEVSDGFISILLQDELATYDASALTRLVIASHKHAVRVAISPWVSHLDERRGKIIAADFLAEHDIEIDWETIPGILEVALSSRAAGVTDQCWDGHPTAADLVALADPERSPQSVTEL